MPASGARDGTMSNDLHAGTGISVVIPVRDDAELLEACLEALARQVRPADEIVVVDNGSTDGTAALAVSHGARVVTVPRPGIPRAASAGYDAATGAVIARLDADSRPEPDWLARIERAFRERPELDFLSGDARFYGASPLVHWAGRHLYIGAMYVALAPLLGHAPLFGSNMAMRASAWQSVRAEVHREADRIHDDFDLSYHVQPWMTVRHDRALVVAVSSRPFENWKSLRRRLDWVLPTVRLHWPEQTPQRRWRARREAASARRSRSKQRD